MIKWIRQFFCEHKLKFIRNLYGDEINRFDARSIWCCRKCGKLAYMNHLRTKPSRLPERKDE